MDELHYKLDELNTRIFLLQQVIDDTNPWSSDMEKLQGRLNAFKIKREALKNRIKADKQYKERVYEPDITNAMISEIQVNDGKPRRNEATLEMEIRVLENLVERRHSWLANPVSKMYSTFDAVLQDTRNMESQLIELQAELKELQTLKK